MRYDDKTVFIPGGTLGIGKAIAILLAGKGADVVVFSRKKANVDKAVKEIKAAAVRDGQLCEGFPVDLTDDKIVKKAMKDAIMKTAVPDILINSAGFSHPDYFENIPDAKFRAMMDVNYFGSLNTIRALLPEMKKKPESWIVNTSSQAGFLPVFGYSGYVATKFALIGLTEVLKSEYQFDNVRFSVLCPPDTETPGFAEENKTKPEETVEISKSGKMLTAEEVARQFEKGFRKGKFLIIPGFDGKLAWIVRRLFPGVLNFIFNSAIKKVRKRKLRQQKK